MLQGSLLLVDDDRHVLESMTDWLRSQGFHVDPASSFAEAVDRLALEEADGGAAAVREQHLVALAAQHDRQELPHRSLVVNDEDAGRTPVGGGQRRLRDGAHEWMAARAGRLMANVVPAPGCELTRISPL